MDLLSAIDKKAPLSWPIRPCPRRLNLINTPKRNCRFLRVGRHIYMAPTPFRVYKVTYHDDYGIASQNFIPAESETDLDITARALAKDGHYTAVRVNLDGTVCNEF
jgi:hypothetical protein